MLMGFHDRPGIESLWTQLCVYGETRLESRRETRVECRLHVLWEEEHHRLPREDIKLDSLLVHKNWKEVVLPWEEEFHLGEGLCLEEGLNPEEKALQRRGGCWGQLPTKNRTTFNHTLLTIITLDHYIIS